MKSFILLIVTLGFLGCNSNAQQTTETFPLQKTDSEWKAELNAAEYQVLRKAGTERAFSSELLAIDEAGTFVCAACGNSLYKTRDKFESGTGWPSFDRAYKDENLKYRKDSFGGYSASEILCGNCGGHLGHMFNDGPKNTTGKRHCINGTAMDFVPEDQLQE